MPTLRDRIVQGALLQVIEPIFERDFALHSYGFRPGKGCKDALRRVDELLKGGSHWVVDADLKSYFDTIPQEKLMDRVREKIAEGRVLRLYPFYPSMSRLSAVSKASRLTLPGLKPWAEFSNPFGFGAVDRPKEPLT